MEFQNHSINKDIPIPLYYQVKQIILDEINNEGVKAGDAIPTEKTFCDIYGISRTTIRQAISELVNEGYPVSYTHLDVYKRQDIRTAVLC